MKKKEYKKVMKASEYEKFMGIIGFNDDDFICLLCLDYCPPPEVKKKKCEKQSCFKCWDKYIGESLEYNNDEPKDIRWAKEPVSQNG